MLDAAEELFREGGSDALTVEAVIERAGTSTGSFYARFGNRRGLFVAMHERFLDTFDTALRVAAIDALERPTLRESLHTFFSAVFATVRRHRNTLHFHVIQNAHDADMRAQGNELTQGLFALIARIVETHSSDATSVDLAKVDIVGRAMHGLTLQMMLFDDDEVTGRAMTDDAFVEGVTEMVLAYL